VRVSRIGKWFSRSFKNTLYLLNNNKRYPTALPSGIMCRRLLFGESGVGADAHIHPLLTSPAFILIAPRRALYDTRARAADSLLRDIAAVCSTMVAFVQPEPRESRRRLQLADGGLDVETRGWGGGQIG